MDFDMAKRLERNIMKNKMNFEKEKRGRRALNVPSSGQEICYISSNNEFAKCFWINSHFVPATKGIHVQLPRGAFELQLPINFQRYDFQQNRQSSAIKSRIASELRAIMFLSIFAMSCCTLREKYS